MNSNYVESRLSPSEWASKKAQGLKDGITSPSEYAIKLLIGTLKATRFIAKLKSPTITIAEFQIAHALMYGAIHNNAGIIEFKPR